MDLYLKGKRAVVLGGTRGIGRAIAEGLMAEGASLAFCARNKAEVKAAVAALERGGTTAYGESLDIALDGEEQAMQPAGPPAGPPTGPPTGPKSTKTRHKGDRQRPEHRLTPQRQRSAGFRDSRRGERGYTRPGWSAFAEGC